MSPPFSAGRALMIAGLVVFALTACGRRGPPEAPLTAAELAAEQKNVQARQARQQAEVDEEDEDQARDVLVPSPTPQRRRSRAYTIPKEPFILDPLL